MAAISMEGLNLRHSRHTKVSDPSTPQYVPRTLLLNLCQSQ